MPKSDTYLGDGTWDFSGGVDSSRITTVQSPLNPSGLPRNMLAWQYNSTVRGGGVRQRTGWQPLTTVFPIGRWQGGFIYEPDSANPYLVCQVDGILYSVLLEPPYTVTDLTGGNLALRNPPTAERAFFVQGENYLVVQAGDFTTNPTPTLPLFWNGSTLRRSIGITTAVPGGYLPNINEIPAATCMDYYQGRIWYAQNRQFSGGDMVGGPSGTVGNHFRDAILSVTENPLVLGGDGFTVPTNSGNIRAIKHTANLDVTLGEGDLFIFTRKVIYKFAVPISRTDWINAGNTITPSKAIDMPLLTVSQLVNGSVNDISIVHVNGDMFYQSLDPAIRSFQVSRRNFGQWGNTPISQNEQRAIEVNDRGLMRFSSGIQFDNRLLELVLPHLAADGVNVVHQAVLPLDFDVVSNLNTQDQAEAMAPPVWEGAYDGLQFLQLFEGDFGGLHRGFGVVISEVDRSVQVWELTTSSRTEAGDNRVAWGFESPAFTWGVHGLELELKQLAGGELWLDKVFGTVDVDVWYREDADPCWRFWLHTQICVPRNCEEHPDPTCLVYPYPQLPFREGYRFPIAFPEPKPACDSMGIRPTTIGYQFQVKVILKGWCRVRGLMLYAQEREKAQYQGASCPAPTQEGMFKLPKLPWNFQTNPPMPPPPVPVTPTLVILEDSSGGFWKVIVATDGNIELASDSGPKTPDVVLTDSGGAFWLMIAFPDGNWGSEFSLGPPTLPPVITDTGGTHWKLIADTDGNLGTEVVP